MFHAFVAKALFAASRGRPDIQVALAFLCTRVKNPTEEDWIKLLRMMRFLHKTQDDVLTLGAEGASIMKWYADATFAVHPDMKSHTGYNMTMGRGSIISASKKQKLNTKSSTEAELIAANEAVNNIMWSKLFIQEQGYNPAVIFKQDNTSTIQLEKHGKASSQRRTRHINIRHFYITDLIEKNEFKSEFCPTNMMEADHLSKPLQGKEFERQRRILMGMDPMSEDQHWDCM